MTSRTQAHRDSQEPPVVAIVGATATGKSGLAVELALAEGGEVVNADAMQFYRGMDIGSAKVTAAEQKGVRHHLLDVLDVTQEASLAVYQHQALDAVRQIRGRGHLPLVTGGSGLYVSAVMDEYQIPPTDPQVRQGFEAQLEQIGPQALHAQLAAIDPGAAAAILPSNGRRIVRALEVNQLTGAPFIAALPPAAGPDPARLLLGVRRARPDLDQRIAQRVHLMWQAGLVAETQGLLSRGLAEGKTASRALGYAQAMAQLRGELTQDEAIESTITATRKFARRQESWFRRDPRIHWLDLEPGEPGEAALPRARALLQAHREAGVR